jgi:hypothetical protein
MSRSRTAPAGRSERQSNIRGPGTQEETRKLAAAILPERTESTETTILSSAPTNAGSRQPQQQIVEHYCNEEIPLRESGAWLHRLRNRIEASREITSVITEVGNLSGS